MTKKRFYPIGWFHFTALSMQWNKGKWNKDGGGGWVGVTATPWQLLIPPLNGSLSVADLGGVIIVIVSESFTSVGRGGADLHMHNFPHHSLKPAVFSKWWRRLYCHCSYTAKCCSLSRRDQHQYSENTVSPAAGVIAHTVVIFPQSSVHIEAHVSGPCPTRCWISIDVSSFPDRRYTIVVSSANFTRLLPGLMTEHFTGWRELGWERSPGVFECSEALEPRLLSLSVRL